MSSGNDRRRFDIGYHPILRPLFAALGMGPRFSGVTVTAGELRVAMGWAIRTHIPRQAIVNAGPARIPLIFGWGVHGWAGRWAVNGSRAGAVRIDLDPPCRARVCGIPVRLRTLWLSLVDADGFLLAVGGRS